VKKTKKGLNEIIDSFFKVIDSIKYIRRTYLENKKLIGNISNYIRKKVKIAEFRLQVEVGTGDAFNTSMLYGMIWTIVGILSAFFLNNFQTKQRLINVIGNFDEAKLDIDFHCIFYTRIVYIIIVGIKLLFNFKSRLILKKMIGGDIFG